MAKMSLYTGVVENRNDPLKLGRVKVRVHGVHNTDIAILPTEDLPWAIVIQPTSSAGISGVGYNPGLVIGSIVAVCFTDPDEQMPIVLGSVPGVPQDPVEKEGLSYKKNSKALDFLNNITEGEDGELVESSAPEGSSNSETTLEEARPVTAHKVSTEGLEEVKKNYPFSSAPYKDSDGKFTIGHGQQTWKGNPVTLTYPGAVSATEAASELERHINAPS